MLNGAREILKAYGVKGMVYRLMAAGFPVTCVGHSLGASTSMFLAAELNNGLVEIRRYLSLSATGAGTGTGAGAGAGAGAWTGAGAGAGAVMPECAGIWAEAGRDPLRAEGCAWLGGLGLPFPRIKSVGFGMPPCVSEVGLLGYC
jgi:hypothetical protein